MATRSMPFWPRPATTSGSSWPGSGLCAPFSGRLSWSGITRAAPLPHPPEHANSLFHRRLCCIAADPTGGGTSKPRAVGWLLSGLSPLERQEMPSERPYPDLDQLIPCLPLISQARTSDARMDDGEDGRRTGDDRMGIIGRRWIPRLLSLLAFCPAITGAAPPAGQPSAPGFLSAG